MKRKILLLLLILVASMGCGSSHHIVAPPSAATSSTPTPATPTPDHRSKRLLFPRRYVDASLSTHALRLIGDDVSSPDKRTASVTVTSPKHGTIDIVVDCTSGSVAANIAGAILTPNCSGRRLDVLTRPAFRQRVPITVTVIHRQHRRWGVAVYRTAG